jgi:TM2 domain-containing membrane protein YozV
LASVVYVQQSNVSPYSRTAALLLCIFLGGFGAHQFYVGKSGSGIAILCLTFCTGLGFIWAFIDFILILVGSFRDSMGRIVSSWSGGPTTTPVVVTTPQQPPQPPQPPQPIPKKQSEDSFCPYCGATVKMHEQFCRNCGAAL